MSGCFIVGAICTLCYKYLKMHKLWKTQTETAIGNKLQIVKNNSSVSKLRWSNYFYNRISFFFTIVIARDKNVLELMTKLKKNVSSFEIRWLNYTRRTQRTCQGQLILGRKAFSTIVFRLTLKIELYVKISQVRSYIGLCV